MGVLRALALGAAIVALSVARAAPSPGEYQVKAVFLFNFAQFVEWPADSFATPSSPFTICVLGEDPFKGELEATVEDESVQGHPFAVAHYGKAQDVHGCHILFIGASELAQLDTILGELRGRAILTVSDIDGAAERGTIIQFANERNRLRLRINAEKARSAGLTHSSKLRRPAEIVGEQRG